MKIGIIAAMEEELALLVNKLDRPRVESFGQFTYHTGKIYGVDVALFLCGIGKVNAAVGTTLLLDKFKPDYLINTGVAGAFPGNINIGDIVVSSEVRHYDADATAFDYEMGQIPQMPAAYQADKLLLGLAQKAWINEDTISVHQGPVLSGDSFIHTPQQISQIEQKFPDVMAVEMEGAAIAQTGFLFNVPFILIRSISDKVHEDGSSAVYESSMEAAAANSVRMVLSMLDNI
ncbi:5'-methylthioadenosine/adenosylhomocysteine nucleosidase [Desulfovibrio sp. JC022]|uniref:5'-methylthioadenosine/adenosylhomocysteine nucleosidase n=1 Tax=Desulfovibrio sp. JC022 TaxID=2593642 RepID=UPI0013D2291F|nr:5'-methylthioadenosine/adenosylhomocysteine nucleosidase [Desulfovibrio sp. JC022]NDV24170.1 5'-methylthioadenosine/adenosylhomocysteine nucleosidase [Desulfovibrio sp. JC022]